MYLIRDVMHCKPGQVRPMVQKTLAMAKAGRKLGLGSMRVLTDVSGERFWTIVMEIEAESIDQFEQMLRKAMENTELQEAMQGYHEFVDQGRREIYKIEG